MSSRTDRGRARRKLPGASRLGRLVLGISITALAVLVTAGSTAVAKVPTGPVAYHSETGMIAFLGSAPGRPLATAAELGSDASPVTTARAFLDLRGAAFGVGDQAHELRVMSARADIAGGSVVRFRQLHEGVPVLGGELVVSLDRAGSVLSASGEVLPDVDISVEPAVTAAAARAVALASVRKAGQAPAVLTTSAPGLWVYDSRLLGGPGLERPVLVWRTDVTGDAFDRLVLVDAQLGAVALSFDQLERAKYRQVCDAGNLNTKVPCTAPYDRVEGDPPSGIVDVNDAYDFTGATYDFYSSYLGRDSIDGSGMTLDSTTRYCPAGYVCPYPNAYWNGSQMVFGQGFAHADDVVGHELTHGVTDYTSHLYYWYQSGAINESLSDVFGELVDLTSGSDPPGDRWLIGEDLPIVAPALRDMANPQAYGDPDRMTSANYWGAEDDGGGVHTNSGVNNKAAFLITDGGTFNGKTVTGLGITKAAHIYYEVESLLTSAGDYGDLYNLLQQACTNLIGTAGITAADCLEVKDAVDATEMNVTPPNAPNPEAPVCPSGTRQDLFYDDLENTGSGNWTLQTGSGTNRWYYPQVPNPYSYDATYATSGTTNFWGYDQPATADYSIAMTSSVALPVGAYLRFNHGFWFEDSPSGATAYDGGVLEYSTNGGATWNDAGALPIDNGYNGTISSSFGNPLGGRRAFVKESNGYISSRVPLALLAGQNIRFRFRIGTDSLYDDYGWFVDDIRIYRCEGAANMTLSVSRTGSGSGSVVSAPAGISCGATCGQSFAFGTVVKLTATAAAGSRFAGWSGACSGTGTCTVVMDVGRSVTARFEANPPPPPVYRTLTVSKVGTGSGSVLSAPAGISCGPTCAHAFVLGTPVTLTATPASNSTFAGWSGACSGKGACTVGMSADRTVVATFQRKLAPPPIRCIVPRVKGKLLAAAKRAITRAHCSTGKVGRAYSARVRKGRVISQKPPAGRILRKGAKVSLVVSKGRRG